VTAGNDESAQHATHYYDESDQEIHATAISGALRISKE
jgi:hypothetical protein